MVSRDAAAWLFQISRSDGGVPKLPWSRLYAKVVRPGAIQVGDSVRRTG